MRNGATLLCLAALAGCNLAPRYTQPVAPIAPAFPAAPPPNGAPAAFDLGWLNFFTDPRLRALIGTALERNRDLAQSYARIAQARAQFRIAATERLPFVDASGQATKSQQPSPIPIAGQGSNFEIRQYQANLGVSAFELDLWGRVRNMAEAQRQTYLGSVEGARSFQLSLIAQVASAYFDILAGEERIRIAEQSLDGRREGVRLAKRRLDEGVTSTIDYDQTVLLETQAETDLADIQRATEQSRNLLDVLVGGPIATPLPAGHRLDDQLSPIDPGLPSALLEKRPDILQAEHALRGANANIGAARAAFFPTITLTGNYGFASNALDALFRDRSKAWSFGGALDLPIFDWGRRQAQLKFSKAQADELTAAYQRAVQKAFQEVADGLVGRQRYAEQIAAQTRTVDTQIRLSRTARLRYDNGISIYLQVLDAERNLFSAGQQLVQLRATELQNAVSLYVALGGGAGALTPMPPSRS
jgi:outer membrane protein, multidrug efflux system